MHYYQGCRDCEAAAPFISRISTAHTLSGDTLPRQSLRGRLGEAVDTLRPHYRHDNAGAVYALGGVSQKTYEMPTLKRPEL